MAASNTMSARRLPGSQERKGRVSTPDAVDGAVMAPPRVTTRYAHGRYYGTARAAWLNLVKKRPKDGSA